MLTNSQELVKIKFSKGEIAMTTDPPDAPTTLPWWTKPPRRQNKTSIPTSRTTEAAPTSTLKVSPVISLAGYFNF